MEDRRKEAEAAQKIVDDQEEKARLEDEVKKLKVQLEKAQQAKPVEARSSDSLRPSSAKKGKGRLSNTSRRVSAVRFLVQPSKYIVR